MDSLRDRLRALPSFPDDLPTFDADATPADPLDLVRAWLDDAIAAGGIAPHAMTLSTVDDAGRPASRVLVVKDVDERGLLFASSRSSRKAQHLAHRPTATMHASWPALGRQIEIAGSVVELDDATSLADWRERPTYDGVDDPQWRVWALQPRRVEAMQARHDRRHVRVEYVRDADGWHRWPLGQGAGRGAEGERSAGRSGRPSRRPARCGGTP